MQSNIFDSMILGTISFGQGCTIAVEGTHRTTLRTLVATYLRGLSLRLGDWCALLKRHAGWRATPAVAVCPSNAANCHQRNSRWMSAVVVDDSGPVGVC